MDDATDTIVAISTPLGRGAIGIVRMSGRGLDGIVSRLFRPAGGGAEGGLERLKDRRFHLGEILDSSGQVLDTGMLVWMEGPRSYTGEDVVELHCHGNPWILERVVGAAIDAGARAAGPGEFTRRAFMNGKLDLVQAEAVARVIAADSERALEAARRVLAGELSERLRAVREELLRAIEHLEVAINFPEDEVDPEGADRVHERIQGAWEQIQLLVESHARALLVREGVRVAICGRPNVGKSSLLNALVGRRRALVSPEPGTTRDVVEARIDVDGVAVWLQDTAGMRKGAGGVETEGMALAWDAIEGADLAVLVVDGAEPVEDEDVALRRELVARGISFAVVLNKSDLGVRNEWAADEGVLVVSAIEGAGLNALKERLAAVAGGGDAGAVAMVCAEWQRDLLSEVLGELGDAVGAWESGLSVEAVVFNLYNAVERLDRILGGDVREDVVDRVFADFCIGK